MTARMLDTAPSVNVDGPPDHAEAEEPDAEPFVAAFGASPDGADTNKFST